MSSDIKQNLKVCERCGVNFECNASDIKACFCYVIPLSENTRKEIKEKYSDCLCADCLIGFDKDNP